MKSQSMSIPPLVWKRRPALDLAREPALAGAWDRLNAERGDLPFLTAEATAIALEIFGRGDEQLVLASDHQRIVAMFVLAPQGKLRWTTFQPSQVPLGAWVAEAGLDLAALGESLARHALGLCLTLSVTQIDSRYAPRPSEPSPAAVASDYIETAWVDIAGSFDDYWNSRGKNLRQNLRKQRNKLAAQGTATAMRVIREPQEMAGAIARYGMLESAGWKAEQGTAIHPDNAQGRYYRRLLEAAAQQDQAAVHEYLIDGRCAAMNLCLQRNGVLVVLKTTYDESMKLLSPASLLREEELQMVFREAQVSRIEYYGRLMEWHTKLTDHKRPLYHLTIYRWPVVRKLAELRKRPEPHVGVPAEEAT